MSRIGKKSITIPAGVTVTVAENQTMVKGPKGELTVSLMPNISVEVVDQTIQVKRTADDKQSRASHGLIRSLLANTITGVTSGFKKTLKLVGTGYRVAAKGSDISLSLGFSHQVTVTPLKGVKLGVEGNDTIHIEGIDKYMVGQMAANIRAIKPPEPYKGKGVRYSDEVVKTKPGKTAAK